MDLADTPLRLGYFVRFLDFASGPATQVCLVYTGQAAQVGGEPDEPFGLIRTGKWAHPMDDTESWRRPS